MSEIKMLPMPSVLLNWPHPTNHVAIRVYARAVAEHNVKLATAELHRQFGCELRDPNGTIWDHAANLQAENERLRAEVAEYANMVQGYIDTIAEADAQAERLAEALREITHRMPKQAGPAWIAKSIAQAALRDHDKEGKDG